VLKSVDYSNLLSEWTPRMSIWDDLGYLYRSGTAKDGIYLTGQLLLSVDHCNNTSEGTVQGDKGRAPKGFIVSRNIIHT
jgi:hypothetical protein